jgi:general secretion pathway protein F
VIDRVSRGESLSEAMGALPGSFSPLYTALVRAGEASGSTDRVFGTMAGFLDWREELKATARQAMIYPAVILTAAFGLILFLLSFVIPRIGEIIRKMVHELPPASRLLLALSDIVAGNVMLVLFCTALLVSGIVWFCRTPRGGRLMANLFGRLPIARRIVTTLNLAQACRSLAVLLDSGLTMLAAIDLTAATLSLPKLSQGFQSLRKRIEDGARLSEAMMATAILPPLAISMVKVGEDAGSLSQAFLRLATMYDREARSAVKNAIGFLEPAVTVLLGLIVGGVAAIVISTLYKATQGLAR